MKESGLEKVYPKLKVKLLSDNARMPSRGTPGSSGLDVYTPIDVVVPARGDALIPLDLAFEIPFGWDLSVYNKSGVSTKKKLFKGAELIDSDYRGNCHIHFFNNSDEDDALDQLDNENIKRILVSLGNDDDVNISASRSSRMNELDNAMLDKEVKGKSIKDII